MFWSGSSLPILQESSIGNTKAICAIQEQRPFRRTEIVEHSIFGACLRRRWIVPSEILDHDSIFGYGRGKIGKS